MSTDSNGGFAFPQTQAEWRDSDGGLVHEVTGGMTLRDYFAARALTLVSASSKADRSVEEITNRAYRIADAMLKAREVKP